MEQGIESWVNSSPEGQENFRKAVHIILMAISLHDELSESMVMKGGILLGIRYGSNRYTTDIDFSTSKKMTTLNEEELKEQINLKLIEAETELFYGIFCAIQKLKKMPKKADATFPSLKITIGYSQKNNPATMRRIMRGESSQVVSIDYSFNEFTGGTQEIGITGEDSIKAYDLVSLTAEKFRSVLQQVVRNRGRRQDIYDISYLIDNFLTCTNEEKSMVLEMLLEKSKEKHIDDFLHKDALNDKRIIEKSSEGFQDMEDEIEGDLPDFNTIYKKVNDYFTSMPWDIV